MPSPRSFLSPRLPRSPGSARLAGGEGGRGGRNGRRSWVDDEDYLSEEETVNGLASGRSSGQRERLLEEHEAPSVRVALDEGDWEGGPEGGRSKSGMRSAFMNMANSIM